MNLKAKLAQLRRSEARNAQRLKAWKDARRRKRDPARSPGKENTEKERGP